MLSLPDDILWHIFSQNTPSYSSHHLEAYCWAPDVGCLQTARCTSHVCRSWRRVMLSSSNIWAKVIDLEGLNSCREPTLWTTNILERTKSQKLYVYGSVRKPQGLRSFLEIVRMCWTSIEILHVALPIQYLSDRDLVHHAGWTVMSTEIPTSLQYFQLIHGQSLLKANGIHHFHLDPQTPNARYLYATGPTQLPYEPQAPLFQNLRVLAIQNNLYGEHDDETSSEHFPWTTEQLFNVLKYTLRLEILFLHDDAMVDETNPLRYASLQQISLPNLHCLDIEGDIGLCLAILLHIVPSSACALDVEVCIKEYLEWPATWVAILQELLLSCYAKQSKFSPRLSLHLAKDYPSIRPLPFLGKNSFALAWDTGRAGPSRVTPIPLLEFLSNDAFDFSQVTSLRLSLFLRRPTDLDGFSPPVLHSFLQKFQQVRIIECNWEHFHLFLEKIKARPSQLRSGLSHPVGLLPELEELILYDDDDTVPCDDYQPPLQAIVEFCKLFRSRGLNQADGLSMLKRLNLSDMGNDDEINFLLPRLDEVEGLEVVFRNGIEGKGTLVTEICGSGRLSTIKSREPASLKTV